MIVNQATGEIVCTAHGKGKEHDFRLFKNSKVRIRANVECLGDKDYQGIQKLHKLSRTPKKKPRGGKLTRADKERNRELELESYVNMFTESSRYARILSERYRNRRKRFGLRFNLVAGLYNYELRLAKNVSV